MPKFGKGSLDKVATCHPDIQRVLNKAIKKYDFTVIYGYRSPEEQLALFKQGRELVKGKYVVVGKTVTNLDGYTKKSRHNSNPSEAVDVAPYPIDWNNINKFKEMAIVIKEAAKEEGVDLVWGGDWKSFKDYPHFELKK